MKTSTGTVLGILFVAAGCQSTGHSPDAGGSAQGGTAAQGSTAAGAGTVANHSGFLGDYSQLKPAPDREGVELYIDRSVDYRPYTKLMIDEVQVLYTPSADQPQAPPEAIARMRANFRQSLQQALAPTYQIVTTPGPDVLRIRGAITGVQAVKPPTGASDWLPIKAIYNAGRAVTGTSARLVEMTAEMEALDPSGKRVVAAVATRRGDKTLSQGEQVSWAELQSISDYWAKGFRGRLDELRLVATPAPGQAQ
jgi:hypothetical protein